jgi:hypothetical protein
VCDLILYLPLLGFVVDPSPNNKVTRSNYDRIQIGMNKAAVEAILGPPGEHSQPPLFAASDAPEQAPPKHWLGGYERRGSLQRWKDVSIWRGDHGRIDVFYDADDVVVEIEFSYPTRKYKWLYWVIYETGEWQGQYQ